MIPSHCRIRLLLFYMTLCANLLLTQYNSTDSDPKDMMHPNLSKYPYAHLHLSIDVYTYTLRDLHSRDLVVLISIR